MYGDERKRASEMRDWGFGKKAFHKLLLKFEAMSSDFKYVEILCKKDK